MKRAKWTLLALCLFTAVLASCSRGEAAPNGKVVYNHVSLVTDESDWCANVGSADYVFIGTVEKRIKNIPDGDFPKSIYAITVIENLKGSLVENIEARVNAGYKKDGTLVLNATDSTAEEELPVENEKYVFLGYAQSDGSILIPEITGYRKFTGDSKEKYEGYIANQIESGRTRERSRFEP